MHIRGVFQIALDTTYWTMINHLFTWGSLAFYFCILFFLYSDNSMCVILPDVFQFLGKALSSVWQGRGRVNKCLLRSYCYVVGSVEIDRNKTWPLP